MPIGLIYLIGSGDFDCAHPDTIVGEFCGEVENAYHKIFDRYQKVLALKRPPYGFLNEDCFIPGGDDESFPIIKDSLLGIFDIYSQLKMHPDLIVAPKFEIPTFKNTKELRDYLYLYYRQLLNYYQVLKPNSPTLIFLQTLGRQYGKNNKHYFLAIENLYSGITNILLEVAKLEPTKIEECFGNLAFIHQRLLEMHFDVHYAGKSLRVPIQIGYRDEGKGGGAFYDHYTVQNITRNPTVISISSDLFPSDLKSAIKMSPHALIFGEDFYGKKLPGGFDFRSHENGLLVITGRARNTDKSRPQAHALRTAHENKAIKTALLTGQPILAICAGSWQLLKVLGGTTKLVVGHNCRSGMPRILVNGTLGHNLQVHRVDVSKNSLLAQAMGYVRSEAAVADQNILIRPSVNSVHWEAANPNYIPALLRVSATAVRDDNIAPVLHKTGQQNAVESDTVEAYESKSGAPIFGIQWHPESYNQNDVNGHRNIITFMAKAGDAYAAKRRMLGEFQIKLSDAELLQKFSGLTSKVDKIRKDREKLSEQAEMLLATELARLKI